MHHYVKAFEVAMHNVLRDIFTNSRILCCIFYLGQAWWRKIQVLGLSPQYKEDNIEVGKWIKRCFGLHFPKPFDVEDSFTEDMPECPDPRF